MNLLGKRVLAGFVRQRSNPVGCGLAPAASPRLLRPLLQAVTSSPQNHAKALPDRARYGYFDMLTRYIVEQKIGKLRLKFRWSRLRVILWR